MQYFSVRNAKCIVQYYKPLYSNVKLENLNYHSFTEAFYKIHNLPMTAILF